MSAICGYCYTVSHGVEHINTEVLTMHGSATRRLKADHIHIFWLLTLERDRACIKVWNELGFSSDLCTVAAHQRVCRS